MKKFVVIPVLFIVSTGLSSQNKLNTGLNIGYCSSTFLGNDIPGKGLASVSSALIGGYFRCSLNDKLSIQPEIYFYAKGSGINTIDNLYEYVYLNYLELPALFVYKFRNEKKLQPIIYSGPAFSINSGASGSRGYLNDVKKIDLSFIAGAGVEVWQLSFQVRYIYGLTRFDKSSQNLDLRNSTISVLAGFNFVNKKEQ
jgi:hypothetical protein